MSNGERIAREEATPMVGAMVALLTQHCEWITPAGSYRREKADIGDVEVVAIPKPSLLAHMDELVRDGAIAKKEYTNAKTGKVSFRWGEKYRAFVQGGIKFDLFLCDMDTRGNQLWLRTGPADANEWMMGAFHKYNAPFTVEGGYIWSKSNVQKLHIANETAWFDLLGIPFIFPAQRTIEAYQSLIKWGHVWGDVNRYRPTPKPVEGDKPKNNPYQWEEWLETRKSAVKTPKNTTPQKAQWDWAKPFLCDDGLVWVHVGYGKWEKRPQDDCQAKAHLEHYRRLPRSREAMAFTIQIKLQGWERDERMVTAVRNSLAIIRGGVAA